MDMDFVLPDEESIEKMQSAYKKLLENREINSLSMKVDSLSSSENQEKSIDFLGENAGETACCHRENPSTKILVLYFIFALGYNLGYGTSIFNTNFSLGRIQSQERPFGVINGLFARKE